MVLRSTRTYTRYFGEDDVAPLRAEYEKLKADADERLPYIDGDSGRAMLDRVENLRIAIELLGDPVI